MDKHLCSEESGCWCLEKTVTLCSEESSLHCSDCLSLKHLMRYKYKKMSLENSRHSLTNVHRRPNAKKQRRKQKTSITKLFERLRDTTSSQSVETASSSQSIPLHDSSTVKDVAADSQIGEGEDKSRADFTDGKRKMFYEDRVGDITMKTKVRKISNKDHAIVLSDNDEEVLVTSTEPCTSKANFLPTFNLITPVKKPSSPINSSTPLATNNHNNNPLKDLNVSIVSQGSPINNNWKSKNLNDDIANLTKEIIRADYLTIDLTAETRNSSKAAENTVIDLVNMTDTGECSFVSVTRGSSGLSLSGQSEVTVIDAAFKRKKGNQQLKKIAVDAIMQMTPSVKGKVLKELLRGCAQPSPVASSINLKETASRATETAEDSYIKEVIVGKKLSRNSVGSNIYNPDRDTRNRQGLRMVVIDGSNVAMEHGKGKVFSVRGLNICIDYFKRRGHVVKAFVPRFRCKYGKSSEPRLLDHLERQGLVVYTPSREVQGRMISSYDDRYIVQCAAEFDGVIVSGDNYRDLMHENDKWKRVIESRLLPFTWVNDMIMFPRDPLGRHGPTLEMFLKH